jgi:hypothetical protein
MGPAVEQLTVSCWPWHSSRASPTSFRTPTPVAWPLTKARLRPLDVAERRRHQVLVAGVEGPLLQAGPRPDGWPSNTRTLCSARAPAPHQARVGPGSGGEASAVEDDRLARPRLAPVSAARRARWTGPGPRSPQHRGPQTDQHGTKITWSRGRPRSRLGLANRSFVSYPGRPPMAADGLITLPSAHTSETTLERLEEEVAARADRLRPHRSRRGRCRGG